MKISWNNLISTPCLLMIIFAVLGQKCVGAKRKVFVTFNPECPSDLDCSRQGLERYPNSANSLLYYRVDPEPEPDNSTTHLSAHILFSSVGGPAVLMILAEPGGRLNVNWSRYLDERERAGSLNVERGGGVRHSMAVMFSRIWLFNDAGDSVNVDTPSPGDAVQSVDLERLLWRNVTFADNGKLTAILATSGDGPDSGLLGENGTVRVTIDVFDSISRSSALPHGDIGCELDVELVNIEVGNFSSARFALETMAVSKAAVAPVEQQRKSPYELTQVDNIDDEYTPGVFRTYFLTMPGDDGFLMWKPVAYKSSSRSFDSFTRAKHGEAKMAADISSLKSLNMSNLISAYYGSSFSSRSVAFNMTFGLQKDKFYNNYRYLVWSLCIGWGRKPTESFSSLILTLLIVCAVFPILAFVVGLPYLVIRKRRLALPYEDLIEDA